MLQSAAWIRAGQLLSFAAAFPDFAPWLSANFISSCVCVCSVAAGHLGPSAWPERNTDRQKTGE